MKIVIDTNCIISALIRDNISRKIIFNNNFYFITPDFALTEIYKYKSEIMEKANIFDDEFDILLSLIFENIQIIPIGEYEDNLETSKSLIRDINDIPFIALAIALKVDGIWSDDNDFFEQDRVKVFRTEEMVRLLFDV